MTNQKTIYILAVAIVGIVLCAGAAVVLMNDNNKNTPEADRVFHDSYGLEFTVPGTITSSVIQSGPPLTFVSYLGKNAMDTIIATGSDVAHGGGLNTYSAAYDLTSKATITQSAFTTTETEKILSLNPDIVMVAGGNSLTDTVRTFSETLNGAGIACCVIKTVTEATDAEFKTQLRLVADIFGVPERAETVINAANGYVADLKTKLSTVATTDVKYVFAANINWGGADGFYKSTSSYTPFEYLGNKVVSVYTEIAGNTTTTLQPEVLLNYDQNVHGIDMIFVDTGSGYSMMLGQYNDPVIGSGIKALSAFDDGEVYSVLPWCSRGMLPDNSIVIAYQIAAMLYPSLFVGFDMDALAVEVWEVFIGYEGAGQTVYDLQIEYVENTIGNNGGLLSKSPLLDSI